MKALKAYFLSLQRRERILIAVLCLIGAVVGLSVFSRKAGVYWRKESTLLTRIKQNQTVIDSRDAVEKRARDASAKLVPGESLSQVQLNSRVTTMATNAGIRGATISPLPDSTASNSTIALHSIRMSFTGVAWTALKDFYTELQKRRPYITIEEMTVNMTDQRAGLHSVQMKLSSIEVLN